MGAHTRSSQSSTRANGRSQPSSSMSMWACPDASTYSEPYRSAMRRCTPGGVMRSSPAPTTSVGQRTEAASTAMAPRASSRMARPDSG